MALRRKPKHVAAMIIQLSFNCIYIIKVVLVCGKIIYILKTDLQGVIQHVIGASCFARRHLKCTEVR